MINEEIKREIEQEDNYKYSDELFYTGPGDLLDTAEGRAKFCHLNETGIFRKDDPRPGVFRKKIWVYNVKDVGLTVKKQSLVEPELMECIDYDANGNEVNRAYEPT